jgi:DNA-binding transcriptional LysR family regulator
MKAFVTVVRLKSFTKAAAQLSISPSGLSRAIANLETHTRTRLLNRTTRHVSLAEGARDYFTTCSDLLDRLRDSEQRLLEDRDTPTGVIRVLSHPVRYRGGTTANHREISPEHAGFEHRVEHSRRPRAARARRA